MKKSLKLQQILNCYLFRVTETGGKEATPIDALNQLPLNALACNRAKSIRKKIKPIVDTYFEVFNQKTKEKETLAFEITENHHITHTDIPDTELAVLDEKLNADLLSMERRISSELNELLEEEYELDFHPIKLSDFMKNRGVGPEDGDNWHEFKGEYFDLLDWLIVNDVDKSDDIHVEGLDEAIDSVGMTE